MEHVHLHNRILFSDKSVFTQDGIINLRKEHLWAEDNPHAAVQTKSLHRFTVHVWCGILGNSLIGLHFFHGTLNAQRYLHFLQEILPELLQEVPLALRRNMYFMHDGAPPHFCAQVRGILDTIYKRRWIGRHGPIKWPPRLPHLTPCDFLWGNINIWCMKLASCNPETNSLKKSKRPVRY